MSMHFLKIEMHFLKIEMHFLKIENNLLWEDITIKLARGSSTPHETYLTISILFYTVF
jgi:hypothetical protein